MRQFVRFDWAIKKYLRKKANFSILEGFLSELLQDDIIILNVLDSDRKKEDSSNKHNRIDLLIQNGEGDLNLIILRNEQEAQFFQKTLYSTSRLISKHVRSGEEYAKINQVISISLLFFEAGEGEDYLYRGTTVFEGVHREKSLDLDPMQKEQFQAERISQLFPEYYLIRVNQFDDQIRTGIDEWIYYLKHQEIKESFTAKGMDDARFKLDLQNLSEEKCREFGFNLDAIRPHTEVLDSTFREGEEKGRVEGAKESQQKIVYNAHDAGIDLRTICQITNLSINEVRDMLDNYSPEKRKFAI